MPALRDRYFVYTFLSFVLCVVWLDLVPMLLFTISFIALVISLIFMHSYILTYFQEVITTTSGSNKQKKNGFVFTR